MLVQYKLMSKIYDLLDVVYFRNKERNPRQALLKYIPNEPLKVIELCTGTASNSLLIAKERDQAAVYGIDRSKAMLEIALKKIVNEKVANLEVRRRDAIHTGLPDNCFDFVVISLVLHECQDELAAQILAEAKRIMKPNGRILVLEWEEPKQLGKKILFQPMMRLEPKGFTDFVYQDFREYFNQHGLSLINTTHCDYSRVFEVAKITR